MSKKCMIIGNSKKVCKEKLIKLMNLGFSKIICADGSVNKLLKYGIRPDVLIGDFDSVSQKSLRKLNETTEIIKNDNQNNTDIEKALDYAIQNGYDEAVLLSVIGKRIDHSLNNISILLKYFNRISVLIYTKDSIIKVIEGSFRLNCAINDRVSIFSFNPNVLISTKGLKYPLMKETLYFGERESISNIAETEMVEIESLNGCSIVIFENKL